MGFGGAIIASVVPELFLAQLTFYIIGLGLFLFFSVLDYRIFQNLHKLTYIVIIAGLIITMIIGFESKGAVRWIPLGLFHLQFSELGKPFLVTVLATLLTSSPKKFFHFLVMVTVFLGPAFLVFRQPDLGSSVVYIATGFSLLFVSGTRIRYFLFPFALVFAFLPVAWHFLANYQKNRILTFLNPSLDPLGVSYNAIQAVMTVGSGMFLGRGLGRGTQSHLLFLPEKHTDFVFASVAEELGFVGCIFLLTIYFVLIWRILTVARNCSDRFGLLIAVGMGLIITTQVVINVGMNVGLLPVTGITLPLVSYGGSSILSVLICLGIVENIARSKKLENTIHLA